LVGATPSWLSNRTRSSVGKARGFVCSGGRNPDPSADRAFPKIQQLIRTMAAENITWGEEKIADELKVKLGIRVAPSTVRSG